MQRLIIAGVCGKDAVLRRTGGGDPVLGFSLAVDNGKDASGEKRPATWYDCAIYGKRAEALERHISKGSKLTLSGRPTCRAHEGKAYLGITVEDLTFQGGNQREDNGGSSPGNDGYASVGGRSALDDEIPFAPEFRA